MIALHKVNKWFGSQHVPRDVDLDVHEGEVLPICGPSGDGKSTLIRVSRARAEYLNPREERTRQFLSKILMH